MKKILLFMLATSLASCSDDSGYLGGGGSSTPMLRTTVETAPNGTTFTSQYRYSDEQLLEVTHSNGTNEVYSYAGDILTEVNFYTNGSLVKKDVYKYTTSGVFGEFTSYDYTATDANKSAFKSTYSYNGNNVTVTRYTGGPQNQNQVVDTLALTLNSSGDILKAAGSKITTTYNFDAKKAPLSSSTAYLVTTLAALEGGAHNITTVQSTQNNTVSNSYSTYTYNADDYPASETHTEPDGSVHTTLYTYN